MTQNKEIVPQKILGLVSGLVRFIDEADKAYGEQLSARESGTENEKVVQK